VIASQVQVHLLPVHPCLPALLGAACLSGHRVVLQHPRATSASVLVGSIESTNEQRQDAVSP